MGKVNSRFLKDIKFSPPLPDKKTSRFAEVSSTQQGRFETQMWLGVGVQAAGQTHVLILIYSSSTDNPNIRDKTGKNTHIVVANLRCHCNVRGLRIANEGQ